MFRGALGQVILVPLSEVLARMVTQAAETVLAAKDVLIERESFTELSMYLEKLRPILMEIADKNVKGAPPLMLALESLEQEIKSAKELITTCSSKSRIYLLINCRSIVKQIQEITQSIGRCLSLLPMATLDVSAAVRETTEKLCKDMQVAQFKAAVVEEEIVDKIESGLRERQTNSEYANELLLQIAKAVGVNNSPAVLKEELQKFKKEKEDAHLRKKLAEAMQLDQIIGLLSRADLATSMSEQRVTYESRRLPGVHPLPPLQSFYCPITREVMEDPVEVASGQTFERSAIEVWFNAGNTLCPTTNVELESLELKPNLSLRQSIEEWRERNIAISISATGPKLRSEKEADVESALNELRRLSEEKGLHRYWIASEGLIPVIAGKLKSTQRNIRKLTLATLCSLAVNNNENKIAIEEAGAVPLAVRSLARDVGEGREAVGLLLELSQDQRVCDQIGKVQGCILLLVTMLNSENARAVENARTLLEKLSHNDQNVVQMAEANHFKPLAAQLIQGSDMTKVLMASALSRMVLTEQGKAALVLEGAVGPLVSMVSTGKLEAKSAALGALRNLSTLAENREPMINAGVIPPLLQLLFSVTSVVMTLKEQAAATLANLSTASTASRTEIDANGAILESDDTIYQLLSLLNLAGPDIQCHLLRALLGMSCHPSASEVRARMREGGAIQLLLPFCDVTDLEVRVNAVQLLNCLSGDGAGTELGQQIGHSYIKTLVKIIGSSKREEEKAAAVGIIGNLPVTDDQLTDWLLEAEALPAIVQLLGAKTCKSSTRAVRSLLLENAAGALLRFTNPSQPRLQLLLAEADTIPLLVQLLSLGSPLAKSRAAAALGQLSQSSWSRSTPVVRRGMFACFAPPLQPGCPVHSGYCSSRTSFCLVACEAVSPLVQVLEEVEERADEAALSALGTLLTTKEGLEQGVQVLAEANAIRPIVRILTVGSAGAKEKAVVILEKIFRIDKYRNQYGQSAQMPLIDLTQKGSNATKPLAAQILAHLNVLHNQSSYF